MIEWVYPTWQVSLSYILSKSMTIVLMIGNSDWDILKLEILQFTPKFERRPIRKYYKEKCKRLKRDVEAARDNNERLSTRADSRRRTDCQSTPYYLSLQPRKWGRSPTPYGTPGTSKCINHFVAILTCSRPSVSTMENTRSTSGACLREKTHAWPSLKGVDRLLNRPY